MLFADGDATTVPLFAWILGAVNVGFAAAGLYFYVRSTNRKQQVEHESAGSERKKLARRDAATEAVPVVARLSKEVEDQEKEIAALKGTVKDIQERERACSEERAADKVILQFLVTWAVRQRNPPPIPPDVLARFVADGSGSHAPLPGGTGT